MVLASCLFARPLRLCAGIDALEPVLDTRRVGVADVAEQLATVGTRPATRRSPGWHHHLEILLVSFSVLVVEIGYTRIISYKLFYYYVYLVIGLALLGIAAGGVVVAVSRRLRDTTLDLVLFWSFLGASLSTVLAYVVVAYARFDTLAVWQYGTSGSVQSLVLLFVMSVCVFASFLGPGIVVASLFSRRTSQIGGLYFADLLGAGAGCAAVIYVVTSLGAPATIMLAGAVQAAGAAFVGIRLNRRCMSAAGLALAATVLLCSAPGLLPAQRLDSSKTAIEPPQMTLYSDWGSIFRVDVATIPHDAYALNLYHDGILGAYIFRWDGTRSYLSRYDFPEDPRSIPFTVLGTAPRDEAILGAAGGHEVLTSLYYGAGHVDAVELNPLTVHLVSSTFADFDGHLAQNPSVDYVTGDGRSFMARSGSKYQLIWYPAPDSYAATNGALSSAYVLSESYLYTTNALEANLQHLSAGGIFSAQFGEVDDTYDLRTTRFVATARQALSQLGVTDPRDHILVAVTQVHFLGSIPLSTILVKRTAFTPSEVRAFVSATGSVPDTSILYAPGRSLRANPIERVVTTPRAKLGAFYASFPYDVTPTTDNDPFFWHFARFGSVLDNYAHSLNSLDRENSVGERVLLLLLGVSAVVAVIFLLLPFFAIRRIWVQMPHKALSAVFFAAVGLGFIFFEVTLLQQLNLFLGYPTYALTVTLMALLVFTGFGALLSRRFGDSARAIPALVVAVAGLCVFYLFGLSPLTDALLGWPFSARVLVTLVVLAPLGLCLGMFMPIGLGQVSRSGSFPAQYVAWGWAVNGFASVVGSVLATLLAMSYGFDVVLFLGLVAYVTAFGAWSLLSRGTAPMGSRTRFGPTR
jgi:hypothetical protein